MLILGLQGSPRKKGNTEFLLNLFLEEARKNGAVTRTVDACAKHIEPCKEFTTCEKKGLCPIKDDMESEIYGLLRQADIVLLASPIFFYNVTAQMKALIDRTQTLWARRYRLKLQDPNYAMRRGFALAPGATRGKNLFVGLELTARYFYDAIHAKDEGGLFYRQVEHRGDMEKHPAVRDDVRAAVERLMKPFLGRKRVLFLCRENACRSQMAAAFAQTAAADRVEALCGGGEPAAKINPDMEKAMAEKGVDMAFRIPQGVDAALAHGKPDVIVTMGCGDHCPAVPGARVEDWSLPDPAGKGIEFMRRTRDEIEARVQKLLNML